MTLTMTVVNGPNLHSMHAAAKHTAGLQTFFSIESSPLYYGLSGMSRA